MANVQWDDLKPSLDRAMEASKKRHANSERVYRSLSDYQRLFYPRMAPYPELPRRCLPRLPVLQDARGRRG